jgi:hypothetical protein
VQNPPRREASRYRVLELTESETDAFAVGGTG